MSETEKVAKFGGVCVSHVEMYDRMAAILRADTGRRFVVVSAVAGVTDSLVQMMAKLPEEKEIDHFLSDLKTRHLALLPRPQRDREQTLEAIEVLATKLERLLYGISYTEEMTPRIRDVVLSFGERLSAQVVASNLRGRGFDAEAFDADQIGLMTDGHYGNATALLAETKARMGPLLRVQADAARVSVVTGFFGLSPEGKTATFGRGGSDYTAAVVAHAVGLRTIEIWKDVDGFMSADPKIVAEAFPLSELSYDEAAELSYFGAKVLHPRAVQPARACGASLFLKNIYRSEALGTRIGPDTMDRSGDVKSVSYVRDLATLKVYATGLGSEEVLLSQSSGILANEGVSIYGAATSQTCVAFLVESDAAPRAEIALSRMANLVVEKVETSPHASLICFVGEGIGHTRGIAARVFRAVAARNINVQFITAGASMVAYQFTVDTRDLEEAVRAVHWAFFGNGSRPPGSLPSAMPPASSPAS